MYWPDSPSTDMPSPAAPWPVTTGRSGAASCGPRRPAFRSGGRVGAFTLVELVVVAAIIVVVVGMTVPAVTKLWDQRKRSVAENTIQGLLTTTRARAMQTGGVESGLFFFVDRDGIQRVVAIEQAAPDDGLGQSANIVWRNVFRISESRDFKLPPPIRVVPRYVVEAENQENRPRAFGAAELANESFAEAETQDVWQRHRNFFALVYSGEGHLRLERDVLIQDADTVDDASRKGDVTGLRVGKDDDDPIVTRYWPVDGTESKRLDLLPIDRGVADLVTDSDGVAINFPSVDGLMVYDNAMFLDSGFGSTAAEQKRAFLLRSAQPLYINRWTGAVIRGPIGEVVVE